MTPRLYVLFLLVACTPDAKPPGDDDGADTSGGTDSSDGEDSTPGDSEEEIPDTTAPSVTVTAPLSGETIVGDYTLEVAAADDVGVARVVYTVDGAQVGEAQAEPWSVTWDTTEVINGNWELVAEAFDAAGNSATASVPFVVGNGDASPDLVRIINPVDGATICGAVTVEATIGSQEVVDVRFDLDGVAMASDSSEPYAWDWTTEGTSNGTHSVRATATLVDGSQIQNTIAVEVLNDGGSCDNLPSVVFTEPAGTTWTNGVVPLAADASDDVGVVKVQFFVDNGMLVEDGSIPYGTDWDTSDFDEGPHSLKVIAYDTADQSAESRVTVVVDRTPPEIEITSPSDSSWQAGSVDIEVTVFDEIGIGETWLSIDGEPVLELASGTNTYTWDVSEEDYGAHTLLAEVTDLAGQASTHAMTVYVDNPPTVEITEPADGDSVTGDAVSVTADADDDHTVSRVRFYLDGTEQPSDTASPWEWSWDTCDETDGSSHTLTATAYDDGGATASETITVTVDHALEIALDAPTGAASSSQTITTEVANDLPATSVVYEIDGVVVATVTSYDTETWDCDPGDTGASMVPPSACPEYPVTCSLGCDCYDYSTEIDVTALSEGSHTVTVTVTGASGDTRTTSASLSVDYDQDADGHEDEDYGGDDCDDTDASVYAGATEVCDGVDQDCDGTEDDGLTLCGTLTLSTGADAVLSGEATSDYAGYAVSIVGDVDGNGYDDLVVGAYGNDDGGSSAGAAYLILGPGISSMNLSSANAELVGEDASDYAGMRVGSAGDFDSDGYADVIIGATGDDSGGTSSGSAYVMLGSFSGTVDLSAADLKIVGEDSSDAAGCSVGSAGDTDGDGDQEVFVGAYNNDDGGSSAGAVYLVEGPATGTLDLSSADAQLKGDDSSDNAGYSVAGVGDADGDGYDDLLVGVPYDDDGGTDAGAAWLVLGRISSGDLSSRGDAKLVGPSSSDSAGLAVAGAGDVDGDGGADLLVGASTYNSTYGAAYLVYGDVSGTVSLSDADITWAGTRNYYVGSALAGVGDVDGNGGDDVLIGASGASASYLFFSPVSEETSYATSAGLVLSGAASSLSGNGDVDGDGYADMLLGSSSANAAYLVLGAR